MQVASRRWLIRCAVAVLANGFLVALKISFDPLTGQENPFLLFLAGIMLSAWLGGLCLGLLTTLGAAFACDLLFITPGQVVYMNPLEENFQLGLFVLEGAVISWGTSALGRALFALREADRRKDDFLAVLAHELRNHLAPMRYALYAMQTVPERTESLEGAHVMVERQVRQMTRLVDDLSDLSRIRAGKMVLQRQRVLLFQVVHDAVESSRPLIERMGHELIVTLPPDPVLLEADSALLVQALVNLLNNAAKYTTERGRIALSAENADQKVHIRVCDTGVGIPTELLPTVFDPFSQLQSTLHRSQGGLGIGLALVRQIVELHSGTVEASSEGPGRGSQFAITLPRCAISTGMEVARK
jgi:signal transduction histidine kinase